MKNLFFLLMVISLSNCHNSDTEGSATAPILLIDSFYSYQSIASFEIEIRKTCDTIIVHEDSKLPQFDKRPPFNIYKLKIPHFMHLGFKGQLMAEFFNNRLQSVLFYPDDPKEYLKQLDKRLSIDLTYNDEIMISYIKVFKSRDYRNKYYVGWEDTRLVKEFNKWIDRFA